MHISKLIHYYLQKKHDEHKTNQGTKNTSNTPDSDKPITSKNDDLLGRKNFAIDLTNAIAKWQSKDNLVIGLYGAWGSGKSSIINMMKEALESLSTDTKPKIIEFNPWIFSEQEKLFENFFKELTIVLKIDDGKRYKKLADKIELYASAITMVQEVNKQINWSYIIQTIGLGIFVTGIANKTDYMWLLGLIAAIGGVPTILSAIISFLNVKAKISNITLNSLKKDIEEELKKHKQKFLIIIDDIDRLDSKEIKQLFKLVRATANFSNIIYLLAFDKNIVENVFSHDTSTEYYGYNYINKIIQVPFDIPSISKEKLNHFLEERLHNICQNLPQNARGLIKSDQEHTRQIMQHISKAFKDIREIKRYINSVSFHINRFIIDDHLEINPVDFLAIEAIRITAQAYYHFIYRQKEMLFIQANNSKARDAFKNLATQEIQVYSPEVQEVLKKLTSALFPYCTLVDCNPAIPIGYNRIGEVWHKSLRICYPGNYNIFDKYFTLEPINNNLSQAEIAHYRKNIFSKNATRYFLELNLENRCQLISHISTWIDEKDFCEPEDKLIEFLHAIFDSVFIRKIPHHSRDNLISREDPHNWFKSSYLLPINMQDRDLLNIVPTIFNKIGTDKQKNFAILLDWFKQSENGLWCMVCIIATIDEVKKQPKDHSWNCFEGDFDSLSDIFLEKARAAISNLSIVQHQGISHILWWYKQLRKNQSDKTLSVFVEAVMKDAQLLIEVIKNYMRTHYSTSMLIPFTELQEIFDVCQINAIFLKEQSSQSTLYTNNTQIINLYVQQFSNRDTPINNRTSQDKWLILKCDKF